MHVKRINVYVRKCQACWNVELRRYEMFRVRAALAVIDPKMKRILDSSISTSSLIIGSKMFGASVEVVAL